MAKKTNSKTQKGNVNLSLLNIPILKQSAEPVYIKPCAMPQKSKRDRYLVKSRSIYGRKKYIQVGMISK